MKRANTYRILALILAIMMTFSFAACGNADKSADETTASTAGGATETTSGSTAAEEFDPMAKYETPIEITTVISTNATTKYATGQKMEDNIWTDIFEDKLGIKIKYKWTADANQFEQKMNVTIASNDLPDMFQVNGKQFKMLVQGNRIMDLTEVYNKYATDSLKKVMDMDSGVMMETAKVDGKLFAVSNPAGTLNGSNMGWIRTDWLKNLGLSKPTTMDELNKIMEAFVKNDPDKNGKNDTYAMAFSKELTGTGMAALDGYFNSYHAYPFAWVKDASGNLAYGSIQPQTKQALGKLQEMYKNGWLDKEFAVKDNAKATESITAGKVGIEFGQMWNCYAFTESMKKDSNAMWEPFALVSGDSEPAKTVQSINNMGWNAYYVVNKNAKNPEALLKMAALYSDIYYFERAKYNADPWFKENLFELNASDGSKAMPNDYVPFQINFPSQILDYYNIIYNELSGLTLEEGLKLKDTDFNKYQLYFNTKDYPMLIEATKNKDESKLITEEQKKLFKSIQDGSASPVDRFGDYMLYFKEGPFGIIKDIKDKNLYVMDGFYGEPTPTMVQKLATLKKMELETFTRIIMGDASLDEFDTFVANWGKLGGDNITKEVNEVMK